MKFFFIVFFLFVIGIGYFFYVYENGIFGEEPLKNKVAEDLSNKRQIDATFVYVIARDTSDSVVDKDKDIVEVFVRKGISSQLVNIEDMKLVIEVGDEQYEYKKNPNLLEGYDVEFVYETVDENFIDNDDLVSIKFMPRVDLKENDYISIELIVKDGTNLKRTMVFPSSMTKVSTQLYP